MQITPFLRSVVACALAALPTAAIAQQRPATPAAATAPAQPLPPAQADARVFADAAKLGEPDANAWVAAADAVLSKTPTNRPAMVKKVAAHLSVGRVMPAVVAYETWSAAVKHDDDAIVRYIALEVLRRLQSTPSADHRVQALEALARGGDAAARQALADRVKTAPDSPDGWQARVALARLGDGPSVAALAARARQGMGSQRLGALDALRGLPVTPDVVAALDASLSLDDHVLQAEAAAVTGDVGANALVPKLRAVAASGRFTVPLYASCALVALGDASGRGVVDEALASELGDVKLLAARALRAGGVDGWQPAIVPVLKDANPLNRLQAAAMLVPTHGPQATPIITEALTDPNPVVRDEAMQIVAKNPTTPLVLLKRGLIDEAPGVRLKAAAAIESRTRK